MASLGYNEKEMLPHNAIRIILYLDKPSGCPASEERPPLGGWTEGVTISTKDKI